MFDANVSIVVDRLLREMEFLSFHFPARNLLCICRYSSYLFSPLISFQFYCCNRTIYSLLKTRLFLAILGGTVAVNGPHFTAAPGNIWESQYIFSPDNCSHVDVDILHRERALSSGVITFVFVTKHAESRKPKSKWFALQWIHWSDPMQESVNVNLICKVSRFLCPSAAIYYNFQLSRD